VKPTGIYAAKGGGDILNTKLTNSQRTGRIRILVACIEKSINLRGFTNLKVT
jgi:hypothetical protein